MSLFFTNVDLNNNLIRGINYTNQQLKEFDAKRQRFERKINQIFDKVTTIENKATTIENKVTEEIEEETEEREIPFFVKIENCIKQNECEYINVKDIKKLKVESFPPELEPPKDDNQTTIDWNYLEELKKNIIENVEGIHEEDIEFILTIDNEVEMRQKMATRGYGVSVINEFLLDYDFYRNCINALQNYENEVEKLNEKKKLSTYESPGFIYMVFLKSNSNPIYTTVESFRNLEKILCEVK